MDIGRVELGWIKMGAGAGLLATIAWQWPNDGINGIGTAIELAFAGLIGIGAGALAAVVLLHIVVSASRGFESEPFWRLCLRWFLMPVICIGGFVGFVGIPIFLRDRGFSFWIGFPVSLLYVVGLTMLTMKLYKIVDPADASPKSER